MNGARKVREMEDYKRSLAKVRGVDFTINDRFYGLSGLFEYEDGGCQGTGYCVDTAFLLNFMAVFNVTKLQDVNGRSCWVTHSHCDIRLIEPLHKKDGTPFHIPTWTHWVEKRMTKAIV